MFSDKDLSIYWNGQQAFTFTIITLHLGYILRFMLSWSQKKSDNHDRILHSKRSTGKTAVVTHLCPFYHFLDGDERNIILTVWWNLRVIF